MRHVAARAAPFFCVARSRGVGLEAMFTNQPGIELVDLRLDHPGGGTPLVNAGNLRVTGGERVLIVGAAGVGTSRLAATVLGEVSPGAGRVEVLGHDVRKLRRSSLRLLRRRVGI